jgi:hypothetical protein
VAHAKHTLAGFPHGCECLGQQFVERLALIESLAKLVRLGTECIVTQRLELWLERTDTLDLFAHALDQPFITAAKNPG